MAMTSGWSTSSRSFTGSAEWRDIEGELQFLISRWPSRVHLPWRFECGPAERGLNFPDELTAGSPSAPLDFRLDP